MEDKGAFIYILHDQFHEAVYATDVFEIAIGLCREKGYYYTQVPFLQAENVTPLKLSQL